MAADGGIMWEPENIKKILQGVKVYRAYAKHTDNTIRRFQELPCAGRGHYYIFRKPVKTIAASSSVELRFAVRALGA